ncbi:MAG: flavin reductase family protein [Betaproteobacteria bacterium]|nr:flavin reductase family protein [Betaproteobacteria bacterium]
MDTNLHPAFESGDPNAPRAVDLAKAYRLLNHGPTVLVSSAHQGERNVMAAAWNTALDFTPAKMVVVIDKSTWTRELVEASGVFALNVPARRIARETRAVGATSGRDAPQRDKFALTGLRYFPGAVLDVPLVVGCVAWLECRRIAEPHNEQAHDLFLGEAVAAWADPRVFSNGHWHFEGHDDLRTLHYVAGGMFLAIGEEIHVDTPEQK